MIFRVAVALLPALAMALPVAAQTPPRLTPLGPVQTPPPSAPSGLPTVQTPTHGSAPIQAQPLPSLTPPDPAFAPAAPQATPLGTPQAAPQAVPQTAPLGTPSTPPLPTVTPAPASPGATAVPAAPGGPLAPAGPTAPTPIPGDWQARGGADLVALDKVTARATPLALKTGETVRFGTLAITLRACAVRAPDQPADATAFLDITDNGAPAFRGWMFAASPSLAVLEHPVYDIRVVGCRP